MTLRQRERDNIVMTGSRRQDGTHHFSVAEVLGTRHASRHAGVPIAACVALAIALSGGSIVVTPSVALAADEAAARDVITRASDLKQRISEAQSQYLSAVADQGKAEAERDEAQGRLDVTSAELSEAQGRLESIVRSSYSTESSKVVQVLMGSRTLSELLTTLSDSAKVTDEVSAETQRVADFRTQQQAEVDECASRVQAAQDAATAAQEQKASFEQSLSDMSGEIQSVSSELSAAIAAEPTKAAQAQATLNYMQNVYSVTDTQARIISAAFKTSYSGAMRCEAWVETVYENAGLPIGRYADAYADYQDNVRSTSMTDIKAGALLYCSGSGTIYGHVGIALTDSMGSDGMDTLVIDNEGSRTGVKTMREWLQWQRTCPRNGVAGFFGWGYPDGVNLG